MKISTLKWIGSTIVATVMLTVSVQALALQDGDRIRIIIPYSPGGGFDVESRMAAPHIEKSLREMGHDVRVTAENVTGGAGAIATAQVYNARPDGTSILMLDPESSLWQQLLGGAPFVVEEFAFLAQQSVAELTFALSANLDVDSFPDLVERSREQPILLGTSGRGAYSDHVFPELMRLILADAGTDISFSYLHLGGTGDVMASMRRGEAEAFVAGFTAFEKFVRDGHARFLFTFPETDWPHASDILPVTSGDYDLLEASAVTRRVYSAPPGTSEEVVSILREAVEKALNSPEFLKQAEDAGRDVAFEDGETIRVLIEREAELFRRYKDAIAEVID